MAEAFGGLIGNDEQKARLHTAVRQGTLAHAFLLFGPDGSGRRTLAREVAAALNCVHRTDPLHPIPCRTCSACRRIASGQFPDLTVLARSQDKTIIGVDEVRALREDMFLSPTEAEGKIYIIEHAESLTTQAQNALLKVLEEPPRRVTIFLLTDALDPILTTVKSRTQCIRMERLTDEQMLTALREHTRRIGVYYEDETLRALVRRCDGVLGAALASIDPKLIEAEEKSRQNVIDLLHALTGNASYHAVQQAVSALGTKRQEFSEGADRVIRALRDLLVLKREEDAPLLYFPDRAQAASLARPFTAKELCRLYDTYRAALDRAEKNANMTLTLAQLCADIKQKT